MTPIAVALSRGLLSLSRAGATGTLTVSTSCETARITVVDGAVRAITLRSSSSPCLGDLLSRAGAHDAVAHARALEESPAGLVGEWLVTHSVSAGAAVRSALCVQLRARFDEVLALEDATLSLSPGLYADVRLLDRVPSTEDLVFGGLRTQARAMSERELERSLGAAKLALSANGRALLGSVLLSPGELALAMRLKNGEAIAPRDESDEARAFLFVLSLVRAVDKASMPDRDTYGTLLRKLRQVRSAAPPSALLELRAGATAAEARRSFRRLTRSLHPDRLGPDATPGLKRASNEVMAALIAAESQLRVE